MTAMETLDVLGEQVDLLVTSRSSNGSFCMMVQSSPPGGGPPPHIHRNEDEVFMVLEGEYEMFDGKKWVKLAKGEPAHMFRGQPHTFRNRGSTEGKMLAIAMPGGLDEYFRAIAPLAMPQDSDRLMEISRQYGIEFLGPEAPSGAPL